MLIDDILSTPRLFSEGFYQREVAQAFVLNAQNVSDYAEAHPFKGPKDFPNTAPPMPVMWFEWSNKRLVKTPSTGFLRTSIVKTGVLWRATDLTEDSHETKTAVEFFRDNGASFDEKSVRWACRGWMFTKVVESGKEPYNFGSLVWRVSPEGKLLGALIDDLDPARSDGKGGFLISVAPEFRRSKEDEETSRANIGMAMQTAWLSTSFMHCKNVRVEKSPPFSDEIRAARQRRGKHPLFRHHTLVIDPRTPRQGNAGAQPSETEAGTALHICRGHFKDFGEKGLFGKYKGVYWWPMHTRGSEEHGVVTKDYKVEPGDVKGQN